MAVSVSGSSLCFAPLPIFAGKDYSHWQTKMKTFFISQDLWGMIKNEKSSTNLPIDEEIYVRKDAQALYYIQQAVDPTIFPLIIFASSAKSAWDILEREYNYQPKLLESDVHTIEIPDTSRLVCCICDIPKILRNLNPTAYTPQVISIGPLHHGRAELAKMEKDKLYYAKNFLIRTKKKEDFFIQFIKERENSIRKIYSYNTSKLEKREYVTMILLDSFFIFELFIRWEDKDNVEYASDSLLRDTWLWNNVLVDLLLFENQLPYSFLSELYEHSFGKDNKEYYKQFHELCLTYFDVLNQKKILLKEDECKKQLHFTGLIRRFKCGETSPKVTDSKNSRSLKYTAKKLSESKVKFSGIQDGSLNDTTFNDRELKLPIFTIDNTTERICCNLMGLEQYQFKENANICSYIMLMHLLIRTTNDVAVLIEGGVLINNLDSNQAVVEMFNKLCKNINVNHFYFAETCGKLDHYCSSWKGWWNYCWKILTDVYFTNIWSGTATIAAGILLLLTLIQTITSILQV